MDHLLVAGAHLLQSSELASGIPVSAWSESIFWGSLSSDLPVRCHIQSNEVFSKSGLAVLRNNSSYVVFANMPVGTRGLGQHKHNDHLSIEWVIGDVPILVDPGSDTTTTESSVRNLFRSVVSHNTVMIDEQEQNRFDPQSISRLATDGETELSQVLMSSDQTCAIMASYTGYQRLPDPVYHERIVLLTRSGELIIWDKFKAKQPHHYLWHWMLHPMLPKPEVFSGYLQTQVSGLRVQLSFPSNLHCDILPGWYCQGNGQKQACSRIVFEWQGEIEEVFWLWSNAENSKFSDINQIKEYCYQFWQQQQKSKVPQWH
jgi:hypothetical protein